MGTIIYDNLNKNNKKIYDLMKKSFLAFSPTVYLGAGISGDKVQNIMYSVLADNPDIIYFDKTEIAVGFDFLKGNYIKLRKFYKPLEAKRRVSQMLEKTKRIIEEIEQMYPDSDYERMLFAYSYLQSHFTYDQEEFEYSCITGNSIRPDSHNAFGVLINGTGVCDGFASAFSLIMKNFYISSSSISGKASFNTTVPSNHQWNIVKFGNQFFHCDVTWDLDDYRSFKEYSYKYFCVDDLCIKKTHIWDYRSYPQCTSSNMAYFIKKGLLVHSWEQFDRLVGIIAKSKKSFFQILLSEHMTFENSLKESEFLAKRIQNITLKYRNSVSFNYKWDPDIRCLSCRYN